MRGNGSINWRQCYRSLYFSGLFLSAAANPYAARVSATLPLEDFFLSIDTISAEKQYEKAKDDSQATTVLTRARSPKAWGLARRSDPSGPKVGMVHMWPQVACPKRVNLLFTGYLKGQVSLSTFALLYQGVLGGRS